MMDQYFQGFNALTTFLQSTGNINVVSKLKEACHYSLSYKEDGWTESTQSTIKLETNYQNRQLCKDILSSKLIDINNCELSSKYFLTVGDKYPQFGKLKNIKEMSNTNLSHIPGQVLVVTAWVCSKPSLLVLDHFQNLLEENIDWGSKVRSVAINIDQEYEWIEWNWQKWKSFEHLFIHELDTQHEFMSAFEIENRPLIIIVNQQGDISYIGDHTIDIQSRINELLKGNQKTTIASTKQTKQIYKDFDQKAFIQLMSNLEQFKKLQIKDPRKIRISMTITKSRENGKEHIEFSKLKFYHRVPKQNAQELSGILQVLSQNLPQNSIDNLSYVDDVDITNNLHLSFFQRLSEQFKLQKPFYQQRSELNVFYNFQQRQWSTQKSINLQDLIPSETLSVSDLISLIQRIEDHNSKVNYHYNAIGMKNQDIPIRLEGVKFFGFSNLLNQATNNQQTFQNEPDMVELIPVLGSSNLSYTFLSNLLEYSKQSGDKIHISVISDQDKPFQVLKLQENNQNLLTFFTGSSNSPEFKLIRQDPIPEDYLIVVGKDGIIKHAGSIGSQIYEQIQKALSTAVHSTAQKLSSPDQINSLKQILKGEQLGKLAQELKQLNYTPSFKVSYSTNLQDNVITQPQIQLSIRRGDEKLFTNILLPLSELATVEIIFIEIPQIPAE